MEEIKIKCNKCQIEKGVGEMKKDPRYKFGVKKICIICENERHKKYREAQKDKEEWQEKERQRHKKYHEEHREQINEKQKKVREEPKNGFFTCESCQMLVKNINVHIQTECHHKNINNGWKDDKEKKNFEHFQPRIVELKKMFVDWKNGLEIDKEKMEQKKARKREKSRLYYLAKKEKMHKDGAGELAEKEGEAGKE